MPPEPPPRPPEQPARPVAGEPLPPVDPALEDELRPATLGELRTLRRWLAVAGVWAVAASAIAIIALLEAGSDEPRDPGAVTGRQLAKVQRDIDDRMTKLEERVEGLPDSDDVSKLEARLKKVEDGASGTRDDISKVNDRIDELEQRVEEAEQQQGDSGSGSGGSGDGATTTP